MVPTLGGGTQVTDFNKGFTKVNFTKQNLKKYMFYNLIGFSDV